MFFGVFLGEGGKTRKGGTDYFAIWCSTRGTAFFFNTSAQKLPREKKRGKKTHLLPFHCLVAWLLSGQWGYSLHFSLPSMTLNPLFFFKMNHSSVERLNSPFFLRKTADGKTRGIFTQQRGLLQKNTIFFSFLFFFFEGTASLVLHLQKKMPSSFFPTCPSLRKKNNLSR